VKATHYPPRGHRGAAHYSRAYGYSRFSGAAALKAADEAIVTGAHIETPEGVANAEAIFSVPGIDLILLGLSDLRVRLADASDIAGEIDKATRLIGSLARAKGIAASVGAQTPEDAKRLGALGFSVTVTSILPLLLRYGEQYAKGCRAALEEEAQKRKSPA
jgi:4-hydroxy-2-oxoheptanedioate aldolase